MVEKKYLIMIEGSTYTTYEDYQIRAGNDLVTMLKNNTDFDWVFVTSDELREGVHEGKYFRC